MDIPDTYSGKKERIQSVIITVLFFTALILFLWLFKLVTPDPPFPEGGGGGGMMMALGLAEWGSESIDFKNMGQAEQIMTEEEFKESKEEYLSDENSDVALAKDKSKESNEEKKKLKNKPIVIKEEKPQKSEAELLAEKFKKNLGKNTSGNKDIIGQQGIPDGLTGVAGDGGQGGGKGGGVGSGVGAGSGPGKGSGIGGGIRFDLKGRSIIKPPSIPKDTQEEGVVVVEIVVDSEGNVIEANPNGRGTTTNSALLKAKARQAALATKFNKSDDGADEQRGTITIVFSFD